MIPLQIDRLARFLTQNVSVSEFAKTEGVPYNTMIGGLKSGANNLYLLYLRKFGVKPDIPRKKIAAIEQYRAEILQAISKVYEEQIFTFTEDQLKDLLEKAFDAGKDKQYGDFHSDYRPDFEQWYEQVMKGGSDATT